MTDINAQVERVSKAATHLAELANALQVEIDAVKTATVAEAAILYFGLKTAYDELDASRKLIYNQVDFMNKALLPNMMEKQGVDKIQVPQLSRSFYIVTKSSCSMLDKDKAFAWFRERGEDAMISETINSSSLVAYMNEMIKSEGIDPPDDIFKLTTYDTTGSSKYTPKK
jgi:hypothetical protein